ncbi:MAG: nucleoside deaminase [Candidatus Paceibacterota bacterium]
MAKLRITEALSLELMAAALQEAELASRKEEVPVGAVIWHENQIIARAHNLVETNKDSSAHAELLAIQDAGKKLGDWRLSNCILAVTLEPCTMCLGAIKLARIPNLIIGLMDPVKGACDSIFDLTNDPRLGPKIKVLAGVLPKESELLLKRFFKTKRG